MVCRNDRIDRPYFKSRLKFILNNHKSQIIFVVLQKTNWNNVSNVKQISFSHIYIKKYLTRKMDLLIVYVVQGNISSVSDTKSDVYSVNYKVSLNFMFIIFDR
jgi:hypothetical protein